MKLPRGLSPIWISIPAGIFILVLGWFVLRLPTLKSASIVNPEGKGTFSSTPAPEPIIKYPLEELKRQIDDFQVDDPNLVMPLFDKNISLPLE